MKEIIFSGGKFGYKNLPKIASTSIKAAIYQMETGEVFCREKEGMDVHTYMRKNKTGDISTCEKRFVVVRDPVERFLSAYKNRVRFHGELSEPFIRKKFPSYYWDVPYFAPGLGQFIDHFEDYFPIKPIFHHCRPIVDFFGNQTLNQFTHVYKLDELSRFEGDLSELTGKEVVFEHKQTGGKKYFVRDLTKAQIRKLVKFYEADYELLSDFYSVDDLWANWRGDEHDPDVPRSTVRKKIPLIRTVMDKFSARR